MILKDLRDYLNGLDLDEVQSMVEIVYHHEGSTVCEELEHFQLHFPENDYFKPYLSLYTSSFLQDLTKYD